MSLRAPRLLRLASAYRSDPPNTRKALLRAWITAEPVGTAMCVDVKRQHV